MSDSIKDLLDIVISNRDNLSQANRDEINARNKVTAAQNNFDESMIKLAEAIRQTPGPHDLANFLWRFEKHRKLHARVTELEKAIQEQKQKENLQKLVVRKD